MSPYRAQVIPAPPILDGRLLLIDYQLRELIGWRARAINAIGEVALANGGPVADETDQASDPFELTDRIDALLEARHLIAARPPASGWRAAP